MELGLPLTLGAVLKSLAYHAHKDGTGARPGIPLICFESGLQERGVQQSLRELESKGIIRPTSEPKGGRGNRTEYQLMIELNPAPETPFTGRGKEETPHLTAVKGAYDDTSSRAGVAPPHPRTVIEPSVYLPAFEALGDVQGFALTKPLQAQIGQWLKDHDISSDLAESTANAMAGKLEYRRGKWWLGKTSYSGIPRTYFAWLKRGQSDRSNGRRPVDPGMITEEQARQINLEGKNRPPPAKVNS